MNETYQKLQKYLDKESALEVALALLGWDAETLAPKQAVDHTSKAVGILAGEAYQTIINDEVKDLLSKLSLPEEQKTLTDVEQKIVKQLKKQYDDMEQIPIEEFQAYQELTAKAPSVWARAKEQKDFASFAPLLEEVFAYNIRFGKYRSKEGQQPYDVLLKDYEECFDAASLDQFFEEVKATIVPLLKKVSAKKDFIQDDFLYQCYDVKKQDEFCRFLAEYIGFDFERGVLAESAHPFTNSLHNKDVRITNHYYEKNLASAIFSVIHEGGHALYELGVADELTMTPVGGGTSMGMHESQSRMYENMIGRSKEFWLPVYSKLQDTYPEQLNTVTLDTFIRAINKAQSGLIRTESDELCYCLHVIIRYEIEKDLFAGKITVNELPTVWNQKYQEYLGVTPADDAEGVLQDIHWSCGNVGYFPSYALGNAIAAQMYAQMKKELPVDELLKEGNLKAIREYLNEHVHKFGKMKNTNEILMDMTGQPLNAKYYTEYLVEKYTSLYEL